MQEDKIKYTITPPRGLISINLEELYRYKELLYIFVWRDIKVRYKQTAIGILWAILQPLLAMVIFSVFFGRLAKVPSDGVPYPIFVYVGLLLWNYYSTGLTSSSNCLIENESIIKKVYFPRIILPISANATPLVDFFFSFIVLIGLMFYYHYTPHLIGVLLLPVLLIVSLLSSAGLGLFLSAANAKYRDVKYVVPFFVQLLMYVTPVIYPASIIPSSYQWIAFINPMAGVITIARNSILGTASIDYYLLLSTFVISALIFIFGIMYFRRTERFFADVL